MKKSFTLIELIFVIVIIGLLASVAVPKFTNLTKHAKDSAIKSVITSVQSAIDNIHSQWIVNDDFKWIGADGKDHSNDFDDTTGYPKKLDDGKGASKLFSYVLKVPVLSCGNKSNGCLEEYDDNKYDYKYNSSKILKFEYNSSNGLIVCDEGEGVSKEECENLLFK
jgi:general secretion pathway protein G